MRFFVSLTVSMLLCHAALAQAAFATHAAEGQIRDAAVSPDGQALYLAVYDRGKVWKVDPATGETLATGQTGSGPATLAVSHDGSTVAVANRLSNNVTLLNATDLSVVNTVAVQEGPRAIAALPGGGFAVVSGFANAVSLIDPSRAEVVALDAAGVPEAVAASERYLAVASRVPPALQFFRQGDKTPTTVALPSVPVALAPVGADRFVAATRAGLVLVNAADRSVVKQVPVSADDVLAVGDDIYVLSKDRVLVLDEDLTETGSHALAGEGRALSATAGAIAVVSPQSKSWQFLRTGEAAAPEATPPAPEAIAQALQGPAVAAPEVVEQRPVQEEIPIVTEEPAATPPTNVVEPVPVEEAAPAAPVEPAPAAPPVVEAPAAPVSEEPPVKAAPAEPESAPAEPAPEAETETQPATPPALVESKPMEEIEPSEQAAEAKADEQDVRPPSNVFRRRPLGATGTRAPRASDWRPSAVPVPQAPEAGFGDFFTGIGETAEGGFRQPTMDVLENVQAESSRLVPAPEGGLQELEAEGNVRLSLQDTDFASDYLYYNAISGQLDVRGNVNVTQDLSTLTADRITLTMPTEEEANKISPPVEGEDINRKRFSMAELDATNLSIHEPARELEAARIHYNFAKKTGEIIDFRGRAGIYYFGGHQVRVLGPASASGEDVWITTCNLDPPHYRIRISRAQLSDGDVVVGKNARLQLGKTDTPVYWPRWAHSASQDRSFAFDFDSGHSADIGYYVNVGQRFSVNPDLDLGIRLMPTTSAGVGFGVEAYYDYLQTPTSPFYRSKGEVRTLYTTESRGYIEAYHKQDVFDDGVFRLQLEQWSDRDFYKDFFYDAYRDRTGPRTFANLTYRQPNYIATATVRKTTNSFVSEVERMPELTYHLLERRLADNLYFTFDTIDGYNEREYSGMHAVRSINVGRLTYNIEMAEALTVTPFVEGEASWYSDRPDDEGSAFRFSSLIGTTMQTRFHRNYPGIFGFSGFKHVVVPSLTLSYRPESSLDVEDTPRFDDYDNVYGRARIEAKIDNILFGRDAETEEVWQAARLTLYHGSDLWNEFRTSEDYEVEMDLRPRPWWGWLLAAEHHRIDNDFDLDEPYAVQRFFLETYSRILDEPPNPETTFRYNAYYGDYDRLLTYLYYDDRSIGGKMNGRLGFAYTDTLGEVFNRELLYGLGYRLNENWGVAFEQRYDFARDKLTRQEYEISRDLHCWEATVQVRDRESGWDFGLEFSIKALPGAGVKF